MSTVSEWDGENPNPMFDRMTDGEIAHYFEDRDREPAEPDDDVEEEARHSWEEHGGKACHCPLPGPAEIAAQWAEREQQHRAEAHGGSECDCEPPF